MIDEKKLIEAIENRQETLTPRTDIRHSIVFDTLESVIRTIDYTDKASEWIPVSERLPEDQGMYLITSKVLDKTEVQYVFYQKNIEMFICNGIAIAWQPCPEPYKGESV